MLDLTNLILNTASVIPLESNDRELPESESSLELTGDSLEQANPVDPSAFVFLFAEVLASTPESAPEQSSETDSLLSNEIGIIPGQSQESLPVIRDNPLINLQTKMDSDQGKQFISEDQPPQTPMSQKRPMDFVASSDPMSTELLECNVALAWINADNFNPPRSVESLPELDPEISSRLEALLTETKDTPIGDLNIETSRQFNTRESVNTSSHLTLEGAHFTDPSQESGSFIFTETEQIISAQTAELSTENSYVEVNQNATPAPVLSAEYQTDIKTAVVKSLDIPVDLSNSQWAEKFSEQIIWLGHQGIKSAVIKIHPEDLGPLEISIKVVKDSASVNINSHSSHVCSIVDQALPKLKEMMAEQGLSLSEVHVGTDDNPRQFSQNNPKDYEVMLLNPEDEGQPHVRAQKVQEGIIDYFA